MDTVNINDSKSVKTRAKSPAKKLERRSAIINLARHKLASTGFDEIRLSDLAAELGLVKGTLYLYFPTKHALFASIVMTETSQWWQTFSATAPSSPGKDLVAALSQHALLFRLIASLHMNIEQGMDHQALLELKTWFLHFAQGAAQDLESRYAGLKGQGFNFVMAIWNQVVGMAQMAYPPENVRLILEQEVSLKAFCFDHLAVLGDNLDALYKGMAL